MDATFQHVRKAELPEKRIGTLIIDTEEDFDWRRPVRDTLISTSHIRHLRELTELVSAYDVVPTYLVTFPVLRDQEAISIIRYQLARGACAVGLQLHSWVTPPFSEERSSSRNSFLGNLDLSQEEQKLIALRDLFTRCFGYSPKVYRAGRYGLSRHTPALLEKYGFTIDTSVAPHTNFVIDGGPDYTNYDSSLFWFGERRSLLEVPLCRGIVGWGGRLAPRTYTRLPGQQGWQPHLRGLLARSRWAERITLSPEGNDFVAMKRLVRGLLSKGQRVFPLSFHSSSLDVGRNPYVRNTADLHEFYDRLSAILDYMTGRLSFSFARLEDLPLMLPPGDPVDESTRRCEFVR